MNIVSSIFCDLAKTGLDAKRNGSAKQVRVATTGCSCACIASCLARMLAC
ncbi:hypothetical protein [Treponema pectinovorum]|nr:hypothetical protein [Treponema pectinovorum]